jgi:uncharacterized integral membrane protein
MRLFSFLFLIVFVAAIVIFAIQNNNRIGVNLFGWNFELAFPLLAGAIYLLGMFTGWAVIGMLKRSWQRVSEAERKK